MRVLAKSPYERSALRQVSSRPEGHLNASVVHAETPKLSLGSTANSHFSNLAQTNSLSAVITSLGQLATSLPNTLSAENTSMVQQAPLALQVRHHELPAEQQPELLANTEAVYIVNLSQTPAIEQTGLLSPVTQPSIALQNFVVDSVLSIQSLGNQVTAVEFSLASNLASSTTARLPDALIPRPAVNPISNAANDWMGATGIGTFIATTPVSSLTSLANQQAPETVGTPSNNPSFDGITVSGQADSADVLFVVMGALSRGAQSPNNSHFDQPALSEGGMVSAYNAESGVSPFALYQHTLVVVISSSSPSGELALL